MNRYHVIAVLGFFLGIFTAATLTLAWFGSPLAVVSGSLGLITLWLVYSYIPEEWAPAEEWIPKPTDSELHEFDEVGRMPRVPLKDAKDMTIAEWEAAVCRAHADLFITTEEAEEAIHKFKAERYASSPAPDLALALQGGQEPPGSTGAGETDGCPICGEPWKDHDFGVPHPVCPKAPLPGKSWYDKISPAPDVGGAGGRIPAEPTGDTGAGESFVVDAATHVGLGEGESR